MSWPRLPVHTWEHIRKVLAAGRAELGQALVCGQENALGDPVATEQAKK